MSLQLPGSFISFSSLLQVTVALISFLETMLLTYLSYKVRIWSTVFPPLIHADVLQRSDQSAALPVCSLLWADSLQCPVQVPVPRHLSKTQGQKTFATNFRLRHHSLCFRNKLHKQVHGAWSAVFASSMRVIYCKGALLSSVHIHFKGRIMQVVSEDICIMYSMDITQVPTVFVWDSTTANEQG